MQPTGDRGWLHKVTSKPYNLYVYISTQLFNSMSNLIKLCFAEPLGSFGTAGAAAAGLKPYDF